MINLLYILYVATTLFSIPYDAPLLIIFHYYCCIHKQKESSKSIYCIFILLVAYRQYWQQHCSIHSFTIGSLAVSPSHSPTLLLYSSGWLASDESAAPPLQVLDELLAPPLLDLRNLQFLWLTRRSLQSRLTLLEPEYCPTSLPVCIAQGSISGQLAPVLIWNTQVLYKASGLYRTRVCICPLDNTVLLWKGQV